MGRTVAALVALGIAAAGCGSSGDQPGSPPAHPASGTPEQVLDPAGNKAVAVALSHRLVGMMPLPSGATRFTGKPPSSLDLPATGTEGSDQLIDTTSYWLVPVSAGSVIDWATGHEPSGFTIGTTATGTDSDGVALTAPVDPAAPDNQPGSLVVSSARWTSTSSLWRIDGMVVWWDSTPTRVLPAEKTVHITIAAGCPRAFPPYGVGIANNAPGLDDALLPGGEPTAALVCQYQGGNPPPDGQATTHWTLGAAKARALAAQVRGLKLGTNGGIYHCPMDDGRFVVIVFAMAQSDIDIRWSDSGCETVGNGRISAFMAYLTLPH